MNLNVLVVDDSLVMRGMILKTLRASGLPLGELRQAGNGREALETLARERIDLVLVDVNMPVMDGEEFIDAMAARRLIGPTQVLVVSSESNPARIERLRGKGVVFIHKPFNPEDLRDAVAPLGDLPELPQLESQLKGLAAEAMERMCFMLPEEGACPDTPLARSVQVRFCGPQRGRLVVAVDAQLYEGLAVNMLGEAEVGERQKADALGELANVICGNLVPLLGARAGDYILSVPEPWLGEDPGVFRAPGRHLVARIHFDGGVMGLEFFQDHPPRPVAA